MNQNVTASSHGYQLANGDLIAGSYIIRDCLSIGPKSAVYLCQHQDLHGPLLALKVLNPALSRDPVVSARFQQEVIASYSVTHPNVVRTHEFIKDGQIVAYTMEYMDQGNLKERMSLAEPIDIEEIIAITSQICHGLQAIHDAGITHRNIKPANIFFTSEGYVKIGDFGIARADDGPQLTNQGEVLGTVGYASPEYLQTGKFDSRSDIYALGMMTYEMLTGRHPFDSANPLESIKQRLTTDPAIPSEIRLDCPLELGNVVLKALSRDPAFRWQSAQDLAAELEYLGVAASVNSYTAAPRERKPSLTEDILQPFVELGRELDSNRASAFEALRESIISEAMKKRMILAGVLGGIVLTLVVLVGLVISWTKSSGTSLADLEQPKEKVTAVEQKPLEQKPLEQKPPVATNVDQGKKAESAEAPTHMYVVEPGDTINKIAQKFELSPKQLMKINAISDPRKLEVGVSLKVSE